jgi:addiction module HigA family antidote
MTKKLKPVHPGEILREEFMVPLGLSSNALARAIDVTAARVNDIACERRGITADTALRLARYFGTSHQFWMNLQAHYDVEMAVIAAGDAVARIKPQADAPARTMRLEAVTA